MNSETSLLLIAFILPFDEDPIEGNSIDLRRCFLMSLSIRSAATGSLLIVGPRRVQWHLLLDTDGEQFVQLIKHSRFARFLGLAIMVKSAK